MDLPTFGTELEETHVPEGDLASLKLSSEGELRQAKTEEKTLSREPCSKLQRLGKSAQHYANRRKSTYINELEQGHMKTHVNSQKSLRKAVSKFKITKL